MALKSAKCRIKQLLEQKCLTQTDLSILTGYSESRISDYITGTRPTMSIHTAKTIANALNVHIDDLYEWIEM